ncbi:hypothetical protein [Actinoplanes sp. NPDC049316]|uniref:hypothetical protein n=1 Tax=Actinoplanes sp. NPDC049316 TaxID=3154727 RepID=UPI00341913BD
MDGSEAESPGPEAPTAAELGLRLTGQQRALVEALESLETRLKRMYLGSLIALRQAENTERFVQAAHTLREMINLVPESLGFVSSGKQDRLGDKLQKPELKWKGAVDRSKCNSDGQWTGEIDQPLRQALIALDEFFSWKAENRPKRRDELAATLRRMDASGRDVPGPLAAIAASEWDITRDYFISVCHYRKDPEEAEFYAYLDSLERFMLDRLRPRTFADFDVVDQIIEEANRGDRS